MKDSLLARVASLRDEAVDLLSAMVAIDSTTPGFPGGDAEASADGEGRVNDLLEARYRAAGLATTRVEAAAGRRNLVGVRRGTGGGRSLALNAHVDTVAPVDRDGWCIPSPWSPEVRDGRLYGLGSTDMKGSGAAMWMVAQALEEEGVRLAGDLHLHSVCGEEMREHELGTTAVIRAGFRTDAAIVTEPTSYPRPLTVSTVAPSVLLLRVEVEGRATHAGNRPLAIRPGGAGAAIGVNALEKAAKVLAALQSLEQDWGLLKSHPSFAPGFFTIGPNILHADAGLPFPAYFPDRATIEYAVWYPPQESPEAIRAEIEAHVATASRLDPWLAEHPPRCTWLLSWPGFDVPWSHPVSRTMAAAHAAVSGAPVPDPSPATPNNFGAACDATFYGWEGIPAIVYGPGDLTIAHCRDESIDLDELVRGAQALALAAIDWCGLGG